MDIRSFQIFCDLVTYQSFTETARRHYLTQPAVSQQIRALELQFGKRLVERGRRKVRLTRAGALVLETFQHILNSYNQLENALKRPVTEASGKLRVGSVYTVGLYNLPQYTSVFLKLYPKVDLLLSYLKDAEIYEALLANQIDIGIVDYPKRHPQLKITPFNKERIVLIVNPSHQWASRKSIRLSQLHGQPFIVPQAEFPVDEILRKTKVRVKVMHAFDNIEITKRAVEVGLGLALVPRLTIVQEVKEGKLVALDLAEGTYECPVGLLTRKQAELSLAAHKFINLLVPSPRNRNRKAH